MILKGNMKVETIDLSKIKPAEYNPRRIEPKALEGLQNSIKEFGVIDLPILNSHNLKEEGKFTVIGGHQRVVALQKMNQTKVQCVIVDFDETKERAANIALNNPHIQGEFERDLLGDALSSLDGLVDFEELNFEELKDDFFLNYKDVDPDGGEIGNLFNNFVIPPFSVFDANQGYWQERKNQWLSMGIQSELGRDDNQKDARHLQRYKGVENKPWVVNSIFDPVLCEILYRWFTPEKGMILDPFAGGSVRGIVATYLERQYTGIDLSETQVKANRIQAEFILPNAPTSPEWIVGDSRDIDTLCSDVKADFIFSCPPYANLGIYSDNPQDLSILDYGPFLTAYRDIIAKSCALLKEHSFACFVVGEVRDKSGCYYNFVGDTISAFLKAGLSYYNEGILTTAIANLPIRVASAFPVGRKLGKRHQNVLIFLKGDWKEAVKKCGEIEIDESLFEGHEPNDSRPIEETI